MARDFIIFAGAVGARVVISEQLRVPKGSGFPARGRTSGWFQDWEHLSDYSEGIEVLGEERGYKIAGVDFCTSLRHFHLAET